MIIYFIGSLLSSFIVYRNLRADDDADMGDTLGITLLAFIFSWIGVAIAIFLLLQEMLIKEDFKQFKSMGSSLIKFFDKIFFVKEKK